MIRNVFFYFFYLFFLLSILVQDFYTQHTVMIQGTENGSGLTLGQSGTPQFTQISIVILSASSSPSLTHEGCKIFRTPMAIPEWLYLSGYTRVVELAFGGSATNRSTPYRYCLNRVDPLVQYFPRIKFTPLQNPPVFQTPFRHLQQF